MLLLNVYQNIIRTLRASDSRRSVYFPLVLSKKRIISHSLSTETEWMETNVTFVRGIYLIHDNCDEWINKTGQQQVISGAETVEL